MTDAKISGAREGASLYTSVTPPGPPGAESRDPVLGWLAFGSLVDHIAVIDRHGTIIATNRAWDSYAGSAGAADPEKVSAGCNYLEVCRRAGALGDADATTALQGIIEVLSGWRSEFGHEYRCDAADGEHWFHMIVTPFAGDDGGAVICHRDVTGPHCARDRLRESYREIVALKDELQEQLAFQQLIASLSARFVNVATPDVDAEIERSLHEIMVFFGVDRCSLVDVSTSGREAEVVKTAVAEGVPAPAHPRCLQERLPWTFGRVIGEAEAVCLTSLAELPAEADIDLGTYAECGVKSVALIPIVLEGKVRYFISVAAVRRERSWPRDLATRLKVLGEIFANAIVRRRMREAKRQLLAFQGLVGDISARFVNLAPEELDGEIQRALRQVRVFFDADYCGIFELMPRTGRLQLAYVDSSGEPIELPQDPRYTKCFPWAYGELTNGRTVRFSTVEDLPREARTDRRAFRAFGLGAGLNIPVSSAAGGRFAFGIASRRQPRSWPDQYIPRLRLLGETIVNALLRGRTESALEASRKRLEYALSVSAQGIWDWNISTGEVHFSTSWIESLGYRREEVPGHVSFWESVVHPDDMPRVQEALHAHFEGRTPVYSIENRLRLKSGEYRWNLDSGKVVERSPDGKPLRMVGTDTDITERKRVEAEMRLLRDQLWHMDRVTRAGMLSASIAHEINQPLAAILANAQTALRLLATRNVDLDELREILEDIERDDMRAGAVISSIRRMLRGQRNERRQVDLAAVTDEMLEALHSELLISQVKATKARGARCIVLADRAQLQQVILNLVMNAVESMQAEAPEKRRLHVSVTRTSDGQVQVAVRDTGPGVAPDKLQQIFEPFLTTKADGTGLGLAVTRSIIEAHGGSIRAENSRTGGARFVFTLPCADLGPSGEDAEERERQA